jgi:acylpyruvate hydrolase
MKIFAAGLNYAEHARELKWAVPEVPIFFMKPDTALVLNNKPVFYPDFTNDLQYELEVVLKIGKVGKSISEKFAHRYYNEIALGIDFTARDLQDQCRKLGFPWEIAKSFDGSAPVSHFVQKDTFNDISKIDFRLEINGKNVQQGNTNDLIFSFDRIVAHISQYMTLKIGDLIFTGTPLGVGKVAVGDHLQAYIDDERMLDFYIR